jgi:hypothetical protein
MDTLGIYQHHAHNPQKNFRVSGPKQNLEAKFAEQFTLAYRDRFVKIHSGTSKGNALFIREVPVFGNGVPDLLALSWSHDSVMQVASYLDFEKLNPTVRAFEFKLSDWRKGLMQAHRYKYCSHASILVLPIHKKKIAESRIDIFRKLRVGLWGFSPETGAIVCLYTPRPLKNQIGKYGQSAIRLTAQAACSQFGSLLKLPQPIQ